MSSPQSPEIQLFPRELMRLKFEWKEGHALEAPGILQAAHALRQWQVNSGSPVAVCTFSYRAAYRDQSNPFQAVDIHKNLGDVDWNGVVGSLHIHDQSGARGREQVIKDVQDLALSKEEFSGIIDPRDRLLLFVKHLFYMGSDQLIHNLRGTQMRKEVTFMEALAAGSVIPAVREIPTEGFEDKDFHNYLQRLTANTRIQFFMGNLKNDRLTYYGQGNY